MATRQCIVLAATLALSACQTDIGRDAADEHDKTALMYAAEGGDSAAVVRLLDDGARIDQAVRPHPGVRVLVAFLMWMQDLPDRDDGYTALHYAIGNRHLAIAGLLLDRGADPNAGGGSVSPLQLALLTRQGEPAVRLLLAHGAAVRATGGDSSMAGVVATAVMMRDTASLRLLLEAGADPNARNPLATAAANGDSLFVEMLLAAGADPGRPDPRNGWTPAMLARENGHVAIAQRLGGGAGTADQLSVDLARAVREVDTARVRALLDSGANPGTITRTSDHLLAEVIRRGEVDVARLLLQAGASPNIEQYGVPLFTLAQQLGDTAMVDLLMQHGAHPRTPQAATYAAGSGSVALLRRLHRAGNNLREHNDAPLRQAAFGGHADAVRFLISVGAQPDAEDSNGLRALDRAAAMSSVESVRVLLEAGADPDAGPTGWTPLMGAAMSGDTATMAILLAFGADAHRRDEQGKNAADYARGAGKGWAAEWLARRAPPRRATNRAGGRTSPRRRRGRSPVTCPPAGKPSLERPGMEANETPPKPEAPGASDLTLSRT